MSLEDLPIKEFEERVLKFRPQTRPDMCYSASLMNCLNDLSRRREIPSLHISLKRMNQLCGYRNGLMCDEKIIPKVMEDLLKPFNYNWKESNAPEMTIDTLKDISNNPLNSCPIVNVSPGFFNDMGIMTTGKFQMDHVIVVLGVNHEIIYYYDPYETYLKSKGSVRCERYLNIPIFLRYWDNSYVPRWTAWAEPQYKAQRLLSDFDRKEF